MQNLKTDFDPEIKAIADYTLNYKVNSELAYQSAFYSFIDAIGCALLALNYPACTKLLGPVVPNTSVQNGARVIGTSYQLDPVKAAFDNGALIRWLDFNDTFLAAEWGHPSDNLGGILSLADYLNRTQQSSFNLYDILTFMIQAHEIQGVIALENSFNRLGLDHVILVKIATTAIATKMLGGNFDAICRAVSQAWLDGQSLRTYRHAPNTGSRKSWAAGDATSRGVRLAMLTLQGEMGYPSVLSTKTWGFNDVYHSNGLNFSRDYGSYVIENVLFKISFPAEFHAQSAVEAAIQLHPQIKNHFDEIKTIHVRTQEAAMRIINKTGPLHNPADRDHCLQYMIAIGLIFGELTAAHYEDAIAADPKVDALREKMQITEVAEFSKDYLDPDKRSIANALQIEYQDGTRSEEIIIEYPIGHPKRRQEGIPLLMSKFTNAVNGFYPKQQADTLLKLFSDEKNIHQLKIHELMGQLTV
ncbi:MAG: bifunctional 2-methylcitrate dehydratase/aconitate hydratase [Gammaproteobacteria bacterium]|nr:bifunctional 2-methylcitrate dehydratase/aconitate hydratase [Gammaproteobacteria bacterium]